MTEGHQASKSRRTRERIVAATVSLIREGGLAAASAKRIAAASGVTWGAAQHHFGSKDQVLDAVVVLSHERFLARLADVDQGQGSIADRASVLVDRMWDHYQEDVYLATVEIIMAGRDMDSTEVGQTVLQWPSGDHIDMMMRIFGDSGVPSESLLEALIFAHCLLTGMTINKLLERDAVRLGHHLDHCKQALVAMLDQRG
ncbi:TetR/AcrR family transcriptional regulator [Croceicoccus estronivorus]|uniref:TetR/AcrR family transcriptional regulator n=1 Tax=Croceicoccus estronivorus TaxID=1172626 RepID=UPI000ADC3DF5|nr:TetR/AcrR family transcriptional regulator [Croceicoccus estronivorus]